ncbi:MAG: rhodanese-like domain-containing protein [Alphaproteobacteria bacterium]|nr:rhodanese-like domain-containing protein [Alphaproteobacteria bacterium]
MPAFFVPTCRRLLFALLVTWAMAALSGAVADALPPQIAPAEALALSRDGKLTIIDIRTPAEWQKTGIAPDARLVDWQDPHGTGGFIAEVLKTVDGDKTRPIAMICRSGGRSARAMKALADAGFTRVTDIGAGMVGRQSAPGWVGLGLPTVPCNC